MVIIPFLGISDLTTMVLNTRVIFFAFVLLFVDQAFATDDAGSFIDVADIGQLPEIYHKIVNDIRTLERPVAPAKHFDVNSFTPFCNNFTVPKDIPEIDAECLRWEEHELDMLLMYIDLIVTGMDETLAKKFYGEIRCLSRENIQRLTHLNAWQVCFSYDYSELIGNLLAKYINEDIELTNPTLFLPTSSRTPSSLPAFSKFLYGYKRSYSSSFLLNVFHKSNTFHHYRSSRLRSQTSCCKACAQVNYFVNLGANECRYNPLGRHCCHLACKSLSHLKIGAASSINYCCSRSAPKTCLR